MKFKHLFLGFWAVCAFASCSDSEGDTPVVLQQIETTISVSATSVDGVQTKATDKGSDQERKINKLTAVVFYNDGSYAGSAVADATSDESVTEVKNIVVKVDAQEKGEVSKTELKVVLLANVEVPSVKSLSDLESQSFGGITKYNNGGKSLDAEVYLPMSSEVIPFQGVVAGTEFNNWLEKEGTATIVTTRNNKRVTTDGSKVTSTEETETESYEKPAEAKQIYLTRSVARIQLESISAQFTNNYKNAIFHLDTIAVINASNNSAYFSSEENYAKVPVAETGAYSDNAFVRGYPETLVRADYFIAKSAFESSLSTVYTGTSIPEISNAKIFEPEEKEKPIFYVFDFRGHKLVSADKEGDIAIPADKMIYTSLVLAGKITGVGPDKDNRSFRIPIKVSEDSNDYGIARNNIYKIFATLTGEGSDNPDKSMLNACVSFSVKVEPWTVVVQKENDVN